MNREKGRVREREKKRGTKRERETYITISITSQQKICKVTSKPSQFCNLNN